MGRAVFENGLLDIRQYDNAALLAAMQGSGQVMQLATLAIVLQGIGLCAVPLFTFALVEGMRHTANVRRYGLRVALLALASEIPYNLAFEGRWWAPDTRSPAAGLLLALLMLWLMDHYGKGENRWKSGLLQAVILAAAVLWALLLRVDHGVVIVALAAVLWLLRGQPLWQLLAGCGVSAFLVTAPLGMLLVHFYNGARGRASRLAGYAFYPAVLLAGGLASVYLL